MLRLACDCRQIFTRMGSGESSCSSSRPTPNGDFSDLSHKDLSTQPTGLKKLVVQSDKNVTCLAVSWREDGNLLCCMKLANKGVSRGIIQMWSFPTMDSINLIELADGRVAWSAFLVGDHLITKTLFQEDGSTSVDIHEGRESHPFKYLISDDSSGEAKFSHLHADARIVADLSTKWKLLLSTK